MKKKYILLIIILLLVINLYGCWNYREINNMFIVYGASIDKNSDGYIVSFEIVNPIGGREEEIKSIVISENGKTIFDAVRNTIAKTGRKIYWSHCKIIIVSQKIAKEGMVQVLDFINRDAEIRPDVFLLISGEKEAKDIITKKSDLEAAISMQINESIKNEKNISKYPKVELYKFLDVLSQEGNNNILPVIYLMENDEKVTPEISGTAIFKRDKMIGIIDEETTKYVLLINNRLKGGVITLENITENDNKVTLEIYKTTTKLKPIIINNKISIEINTEINADIGEIMGKDDIISTKEREEFVSKAENIIKQKIMHTIRTIQEYDTDIFGFGNLINKDMPSEWNKIKGNWDEVFLQVEPNINLELNIMGSALNSKPIKVGE